MQAIDCSSPLTSATAAALKSSGILAVGRYLGGDYALTPAELSIIHDAGLSVFLIWESNPTNVDYFNYSKGFSDAQLAAEEAVYLGAPSGTAIYFTVDFDAQGGDLGAIVDYFRGVRSGLVGGYLVGAYGSHRVLQALNVTSYVDKYWQTYAWSNGQVFSGNDIYQYQNGVTVQGVDVDRDTIQYNSGCWPEIGGPMDNLVLYFGDADLQIAADLADNLHCQLIHAVYATPELLASATNKYQVGGESAPAGVMLLAGLDRFATMAAVLKMLGKV